MRFTWQWRRYKAWWQVRKHICSVCWQSFSPASSQSLSVTLWSITAKNTDWSTGLLARPIARSLAPLTRSLTRDCSLRSLVGQWLIRLLFCLFFSTFDHSASLLINRHFFHDPGGMITVALVVAQEAFGRENYSKVLGTAFLPIGEEKYQYGGGGETKDKIIRPPFNRDNSIFFTRKNHMSSSICFERSFTCY